MTTLPEMTAAARVWTVAGRELHLSPLTDRDWGTFIAAAQDAYLAPALRIARTDPDIGAPMLDRDLAHVRTFTLQHPDVVEFIKQPHGQSQLILLSLQHRHPSLTIADVSALLGMSAARAEAMQLWTLAQGLPQKDSDSKKGPATP